MLRRVAVVPGRERMSPKMRTKADMLALRDGLYAVLVDYHAERVPMRVRQVAYQAVVRGLITKTEAEMHKAARRFPAGKQVHVLYFGDLDPTGDDIPRVLQEKLDNYGAPPYTLTRIALKPEHVARYHLPTRPTKRRRGMRNPEFEGESVELDALPPDV